MTDFVGRVMRPERDDWVIRSLLDVDFYKFLMAAYIHARHRGVHVKFGLINRAKHIPIASIVSERELRTQLDHVRELVFRRTDISWLRGQDVYGDHLFSKEFIEFLKKLRLGAYTLETNGDQYRLTFEGPWEVVTFWETISLAIISELFYRALMREMTEPELETLYRRASEKLERKLEELASHPEITFADFGQRRRHSFLWQQHVDKRCRAMLPNQFRGTSNTWLAFNLDLVPIGTNAHELPMILTALADGPRAKRDAQYAVLREWAGTYTEPALRIMLPDTFGSWQFFQNMPKELAEGIAHTWRGMRQDSGDPVSEGLAYIAWLTSYGVDPKTKLLILSDGLDVPEMLRIYGALGNQIQISFGWGTLLTNDFIDCHPRKNELATVRGRPLNLTWSELFRGHSFVCKPECAEGNPAIKFSNNRNKATGPTFELERYDRIFGHEGMVEQKVFV